jgi:hypothetical protein
LKTRELRKVEYNKTKEEYEKKNLHELVKLVYPQAYHLEMSMQRQLLN